MSDGSPSIAAASPPSGPFCKHVLARRIVEARSKRAEEEFVVLNGDDGRWRYVSTRPESMARRDALFVQDGGTWSLLVNSYGGEGSQLLCDDAVWPDGLVVGSGARLTYEQAVGQALRWLSEGRVVDQIG